MVDQVMILKESGDFFYYGSDEFLVYCDIYQFIPCKMAGWGKLSEKHLKCNKIMLLLEYHRFVWLTASYTPNNKVQTLRYTT